MFLSYSWAQGLLGRGLIDPMAHYWGIKSFSFLSRLSIENNFLLRVETLHPLSLLSARNLSDLWGNMIKTLLYKINI